MFPHRDEDPDCEPYWPLAVDVHVLDGFTPVGEPDSEAVAGAVDGPPGRDTPADDADSATALDSGDFCKKKKKEIQETER